MPDRRRSWRYHGKNGELWRFVPSSLIYPVDGMTTSVAVFAERILRRQQFRFTLKSMQIIITDGDTNIRALERL